MLSVKIVAAVAALAAVACTAAPCRADPPSESSLELIRPLGDVYNERATDGGAYPQSLGLRVVLARHDYAVTLQYWRNVYLTESGGPRRLPRLSGPEGRVRTATPFNRRAARFAAPPPA